MTDEPAPDALGRPVIGHELTTDGLTLTLRGRPDGFWPWSAIAGVAETPDGLRFDFNDGTHLALRLDAAERAASLAVIHAQLAPAAPGEALAPAMIEAWLGLGPGQNLVWRRPWTCRWEAAGRLLAWAGWLFTPGRNLMRLRPDYDDNRLLTGALAGWRECDVVAADGRGLVARRGRRRRRCAWSEISGVDGDGEFWRITTNRGPIDLGEQPPAGRIVDVARRVLAMRQAGRAVPAEAPAPDSALSRAGGEAAADDKGLSRTE
jgi:hypothetical protein